MLVESGRYDTHSNFTVVIQPLLRDVIVPLLEVSHVCRVVDGDLRLVNPHRGVMRECCLQTGNHRCV